jgi:methyl-accepting chemotaxis protein
MFRNMKLGLRLVLGISVILVLMLVVGFSGYFGLSRVLQMTKFYRSINTLQQNVSALKEWTDQYFIAVYSDQDVLRRQAIRETQELANRGLKNVTALKQQAEDVENDKNLSRLIEGLTGYRESFDNFIRAEEEKTVLANEANSIFNQLSEQINKGQLWIEQMTAAGSVFVSTMNSYFAKNSDKNWKRLADSDAKLKKSIDDWASKVENSGDLRAVADEIKASYNSSTQKLGKYRQLVSNQQQYKELMLQNKKSLVEVCSHFVNLSARNLENQTGFSHKMIMTSLIAAMIIGILFALISVKTILSSMKKVIVRVTEGAEQTLAVAGQVSAASQSLAAGASEQAASIQETSSSLEEMAGVTKQNAHNAQRANEHMQSANQLVDRANGVMANLTNSMHTISKSSEDTHNIVKKIDEIAFQTNLLALNAAVEAARAGEAGSGFAVVADEVRNLAMRAAAAAKDTAQLIENTVRQIKDGSGLVSETRNAFEEVAGSVTKAGELVGEITAASGEQAQGIEQVSHVVLEMDRVTQQNAALAEESAGASEELNAQAAQMTATIDELGALIGASKIRKSSADSSRSTDCEDEIIEDGAVATRSEEDEISDVTARQGDEIPSEQMAAPVDSHLRDF